MTLTVNPLRAMTMNYSRAKVQRQRSADSQDKMETNERTDRRTDGGECITSLSLANAVESRAAEVGGPVRARVCTVYVRCGAGISDEPSQTIVIRNVSRYSDDLYECVASNGVPPAAVRRSRVTVECQYTPSTSSLHAPARHAIALHAKSDARCDKLMTRW